ncbi:MULTISPECIES: DUF3307 domain-containing protein [Roseobacteraceae]|uniref:DUF3307 domain-containing protein n=1 Tax=Celeribacter baekdonensis B30 TaxID=1208323 RepID=K2JAF0_9RHOB|nr:MULTISPECIES: DUF3307 domain-containing protein [Roseobacteraceae]EKE71812.1 hypothetical protein B30_08588 [Celeribacter baekdonensis B30]KAB6715804.1 DUF3307 domain-containing protein [Roseobacter sp. TSBP12]
MPETLAALFLAHVLADYVFQSSAMVDTKSKPETLFLHFLIVLLTAMATTGQVASPAIYALALVHVTIDAIKVTAFSDKFLPHLSDQALHLLTLAIFAKATPDIYATGAYGDLSWLPKLMLYAAGLIYVTRAGGFAVGKLMAGFGANPIEESLDKGGFWIGLLERGLIFLLLIGNMAGGIGFLVAAKSVLRFEATQDGKKAEWVIIGTLASFGWALAVTLAVMFVGAQLPDLGIAGQTP